MIEKEIIINDNVETESPDWLRDEGYEGQLAVDVFQNEESFGIQSAIAGVEADDLDITVNRDMVVIRGKRKNAQVVAKRDYLFQECYWGNFSRSIILPMEVASEKVQATLRNGILTITLPKSKHTGVRVVAIEEE